MTANLRGILLLTLSMAAFAIEDAMIKLASGGLPAGQILLMIGVVGTPVFALWGRAKGQTVFSRAALNGPLWWRNLFEVIGTLGFVTSLTLIPLSTATAILQATPIAVTAGAALFFGETVGWRRWTAVLVGFSGVILILRPGLDSFDINALWAVLGVMGLSARDLATRRMPAALPTMVVATWGFVSVAALGAVMMAVSADAVIPDARSLGFVAGALAVGIGAYWCIIEATRAGDMSAIQPFRYSRLVFALILAVLVFGERPDTLTLFGTALIIGAGLYTLLRERTLSRRRTTR